MSVSLHEDYIPSNGFAAKQFGVMEVEINSQLISSSKTTCEYFLADYMTKFGNFNRDYVSSAYQIEGYYDHEVYDYLTQPDKEVLKQIRRPQCFRDGDHYVYELVFFPSNGFCLDNKPLPLNTTMKLKFNRLRSEFSTVYIGSTPEQATHKGKPLEIKDCYAVCEYVSSPSIRNYFTRIKSKPISYKYQEITVSTRDIPEKTGNLTLHNIKGGNTPAVLFFGLTNTKSFQGAIDKETTAFGFHQDLQNINLTLNGQSCLGYPMRITNQLPIWPYFRLMDVMDKLVSSTSPNTLSLEQFKKSSIFAHEFSGTEETQGWMNLVLDFKEPTTEAQTLVMWSCHSVKITIDEHGTVEKEVL
ncbi:Oidioi.mRNA.OKI2018_I69.chr1.g1241.t1.cds [Oikopleura dioica]|uniref:Oidioi.mRNA.OKI2018_I69.chr1.g1241.t1.cds n=1 Tax=Oikopleura dioica TaxID=34765 RepID=A0ABN7SP10_OIKDI|nr:Oidioi.mRNA.OKI2018_I69.chr1.g1241.t1.cds [Oikopleura dioica]